VHDADPVFASPDGQRVADALRRIPFVVSTSPVLTDTVAVADLVLPDALSIERRSDVVTIDGEGHPVVSTSPPAAVARADSRSAADVVLQVARGVGGSLADRFPWTSHDEILRQRVVQIFESGVGDVFASTHRSVWTQLLERSGWRASSYQTLADLQRGMEERGGWWDPAYHHGEWRRVVARADRMIDLGPVRRAIEWDGAGERGEGPDSALLMYVSPDLALDTRVGGSLPYLQDLGSPLYQAGWTTGAGLNPGTAARLQLAAGAGVRVRSARDEIVARVYVSPGIRPDVVVVHTGGGREHGGRYAAGLGSNPLRLVLLGRSDRQGVVSLPTPVTVEPMA
jgi:anaerobic selenocysteine-containing dehydrogenase